MKRLRPPRELFELIECISCSATSATYQNCAPKHASVKVALTPTYQSRSLAKSALDSTKYSH